MSFDTVPKDLRGLRACLVCSLIKVRLLGLKNQVSTSTQNFPFQTVEQFEYDGCDNCESFLRMKKNKDKVMDVTSNNFDGMIALMSPEDSWVAKWQRINRFTKGVYAISVSGRLPNSVVREMKQRGITYKSRDISQRQ